MAIPAIGAGAAYLTNAGGTRDNVNSAVGSFFGKNAPKPPDYQGAANAQSQGSQVNMSGPNSSQTWTTGPDGRPVLSSALNGDLAGANTALQGQIAGAAGQPLPDGSAARQQAIDASYGAATSRLDPRFAQMENALRTQLSNQGLDPNSEAAKNATQRFGQERNDAYGQAMNSAILQGNEAGNAIFNQGMQSRQMPYQLLNALSGVGGQQFGASAAGYQGPQSLAAAMGQGNYDLQRWMTEQQRNADLIKGGTGLVKGGIEGGMAALPYLASDARLKMNIIRHSAEAIPGVPIATWEWNGRPGEFFVGVIAQDLQRVAPQYVHEAPDGTLMVDYSFLEA
jgi:hypothetical protein